MKRLLLGTGVALATLAQFALADSTANKGFYAGAAVSRWQYEQLAPSLETHVQTLELNSGFWFHPLLSAEVRVGTGLGDEPVDTGNTTWEVGVESTASIYWRPEVANDRAKLYGLLGYSRVELDASNIAGTPRQHTDEGASFGAGLGFHYNNRVLLNLEWKQLIDADGFEMSGFTAGFDYRF